MTKGRIAGAALALLAASGARAHAGPGDTPKPFVVTTFDKARTSSEALRGQVIVINRWATWCGPCKAELPVIDAYYRAHAAQGLRIFAVTTEDSLPTFKLRPLAALLSFPLALRISTGQFPELEGVPTSYVIDRQGVVRYARAAAFTPESLDALLGPLLAEPAPPQSQSQTVAAR